MLAIAAKGQARQCHGAKERQEDQASPWLADQPECEEMSEFMERQREENKQCSHPAEPHAEAGKRHQPRHTGDTC